MAGAPSIPLECTICNRTPKFTDLSHLLTHVGSKGHLSTYYKAKVQANTDNDMKALVEAYDQWYAKYNIDGHMTDRFNQKDKKRARASRKAASVRNTPLPSFAPSKRRNIANSENDTQADPFARRVKTEYGGSYQRSQGLENPSSLRSVPHQSHLWPDSRSNSVVSNLGSRMHELDAFSETSESSGRYNKNFAYDGDYDFPVQENPDAAKLKGVLWPGMDIFDSATPEMRRKRNQKKDGSVLEQLETNSLQVEAIELVFTPWGSLKRERKISGLPSEDSSPIPEDTPSPRQPRCYRRPLFDMDPNKARQSYQSTRQALFTAAYNRGVDDQAAMRPGPSINGERRRRAFDVFRDEETPFGHPMPMTYLTADFQAPISQLHYDTTPFAHHPLDYKPLNDHFQGEEKDFLGGQPVNYHYQNDLQYQGPTAFQQYQTHPPHSLTQAPHDFGGMLANQLGLPTYTEAPHRPESNATVPPPSDG